MSERTVRDLIEYQTGYASYKDGHSDSTLLDMNHALLELWYSENMDTNDTRSNKIYGQCIRLSRKKKRCEQITANINGDCGRHPDQEAVVLPEIEIDIIDTDEEHNRRPGTDYTRPIVLEYDSLFEDAVQQFQF